MAARPSRPRPTSIPNPACECIVVHSRKINAGEKDEIKVRACVVRGGECGCSVAVEWLFECGKLSSGVCWRGSGSSEASFPLQAIRDLVGKIPEWVTKPDSYHTVCMGSPQSPTAAITLNGGDVFFESASLSGVVVVPRTRVIGDLLQEVLDEFYERE